MTVRFVIAEEGYALLTEVGGHRTEIAALPGGVRALLPVWLPVDEGALERAVEVAEDWLMPHAERLRGETLEVSDQTGRLRAGLKARLSIVPEAWSTLEIEALFLRLVDLATGRLPPPDTLEWPVFVADVLMLRELAHHGQVKDMRILP